MHVKHIAFVFYLLLAISSTMINFISEKVFTKNVHKNSVLKLDLGKLQVEHVKLYNYRNKISILNLKTKGICIQFIENIYSISLWCLQLWR